MKKIFCISIVSLFFIWSKPALAQTNKLPNQTLSPKEMILKSPVDRRIKIALLSGETIEGRIANRYQSYCIILMKPDKSPYLIHYSKMKEVKIYSDFFRKLKRGTFQVIKAPIYIVFSIVQVSYWIAEEIFEDIFRRGRSN